MTAFRESRRPLSRISARTASLVRLQPILSAALRLEGPRLRLECGSPASDVDQDAEQILRRAGKKAKPERDEERILLRVFFHPHGKKVVLLLSGYDKGKHTSAPYQNEQIAAARKLLEHWKQRQKTRR